MWDKPRILPILALAAVALLFLKCMSVWTDLGAFLEAASEARAASPEGGSPAEPPPAPAEAQNAAATPSDTGDAADDENAPTPAEGESSASGNAQEKAKADESLEASDGLQFTRAEVEVLQNLSARRAELDKRAREIDLKEKLLAASEQRVNERIAELKAIEANIQTLLAARKDAEESQIKSLVKVYENMKPKDAARIFEELEMDILLPVAQRMKEAKFALILAQMDAEKAKRLTVGLAKQLELPGQKAPEQKS